MTSTNACSIGADREALTIPRGVEFALQAALNGYAVLPLTENNTPFSSEATAAALGVEAGGKGGVYHARSDEHSIRSLFSGRRAGARIGLAMGNGRMAIDCDEKRGVSGTATLKANGWSLPNTAHQATQSGGFHFIVRVPPSIHAPTDKGSDGLGPGLDRRGDGGYIALYDPDVLTMPVADAPEWSLCNAKFGRAPRPAAEHAMRAPTYEVAVEALRSRDPADMDRNEWLSFSGSFYTATFELVHDEQAWMDWQAWNVAYPTNDPAANARTWRDFARNGTQGDFKTLADLGTCQNAKAWRLFGAVVRDLPAITAGPLNRHNNNFFCRASDMEIRTSEYHIQELIETDALAVLFGDPAAGKSFIALDMACCVATGHDFHGHEVKQGAVFYIAGEGRNGIRRRLTAWEHHNGESLRDAPLYVSQSAAQFLDGESADMVASAIKSLSNDSGIPRLIIIDTLARNFGVGDENSQKDMNTFVAAMDDLRRRYIGCTIIIVHHSGHGDKDRARGSSVLKGAVDAEYKVAKKDDCISFAAFKMKDGKEPMPMEFRLDNVGDSAALTYVGEMSSSVSSRMTQHQKLALDAFDECGSDNVSERLWRDQFKSKHQGTDQARRKAFQRARDWLVHRNILRTDDQGVTYSRAAIPGIIPLRDPTSIFP